MGRITGWRRPIFRVLLKIDTPRSRTWAVRLGPGFKDRMRMAHGEDHEPSYTVEEIRQRFLDKGS